MNNKGFAVSSIMYSILVLFLILIFSILGILGSRKLILDKLKNDVISKLNHEYIDISGVTNSNAAIRLSQNGNTVIEIEADNDGNYSLLNLNPGIYKLEVTKDYHTKYIDNEYSVFANNSNMNITLYNGDFNNDNIINNIDKNFATSCIGSSSNECKKADINKDNVINSADVDLVEANHNRITENIYSGVVSISGTIKANSTVQLLRNNKVYNAVVTGTNYVFTDIPKGSYHLMAREGNSEYTEDYVVLTSDNNNKNIEIVYKEPNVNYPDLLDNMIPVKYVIDHWVYADLTSEWYNYNDREWANAVILKSGVTKTVGDTINVDTDVSQMYVWIPRYKYTIFNGNNGSAPVQQINVTFESGTYSTGTVHCTDQITAYSNAEDEIDTTSVSETCSDADQAGNAVVNGTSTYTHPAFTLNGHQLTGIWVGKFEASNVTGCTATNGSIETDCDFTTLGIQIKPNVNSWRGARVGTFYTAIKSLSTTNNDSHMMKNMEWGAVAYLTKSQYGLGTTDIGINNYNGYMTGCGIDAESNSSNTCNAYDTTDGKKASTTGNIYGIYDMSGGTYEYTMSNLAKTSTAPIVGYNAQYNTGFAGTYYNGVQAEGNNAEYTLDLAYTDLYSYDESYNTRGRGKLGDATKETLTDYNGEDGFDGWTDDYASFPYSDAAWFGRGGYYNGGAFAGVFIFSGADGRASVYYAARAVLSRAYSN